MRRKRRPWTAKDDDLLRKFHAEGKIDRDIAYILDRPHSIIFRQRTAVGLKANGTPGTVKGDYKHPEEAKAKIAAAQRRRWKEDEQYRSHCLEKLHQGRVAHQATCWHIPTEPTARKYYFKVRALYGPKYAQAAVGEIMSTKD